MSELSKAIDRTAQRIDYSKMNNEFMKKHCPFDVNTMPGEIEYYECIESLLKELDQYRSIGTPEQFASYKAMLDDEMYCDRMLEAIGKKMTDELSEYKSIGTPDECRAAVEKQNLKKAIYHKVKGGFCGFYQCPSCKWKIEIDEWYRHCPNCGQHIYMERDAE